MAPGSVSGVIDSDRLVRDDETSPVLRPDVRSSRSALGPPHFAVAPADEPLTWAAIIFLAFIVVFGAVYAAFSAIPGTTFVTYCVAVAPSLLVAALVVYRLRDPVISKSFLLGFTFITAVPGILVITIVGAFHASRGVLTSLRLGAVVNMLICSHIPGVSTPTNS
jgi:hypothetical protein